jgi:hypothetical protein
MFTGDLDGLQTDITGGTEMKHKNKHPDTELFSFLPRLVDKHKDNSSYVH